VDFSLVDWDCFAGPLVVTQRALEGDGASGFISIEIGYEPPPQNAQTEAEAAAEAAAAAERIDLRDGVSLRLRAFRKSDRKQVADVRGRGLFQLYNLAIHGFLDEGEVPPAPVPAAAADPKAKAAPKKDDKKGGKGGPTSVEGTEVVLELSIDESAMIVPSSWRSRLPYVFNGEAATDDSSSSSSSSSSGAEGQEGAEPCHAVPPVSPKFSWTIDVLAGLVNDCRSDTASLETCANLKNAWEDAQEGRAAKAAAALALFRERAKAKLVAEPSGAVSEAVLELLATALEREAADFRSREEVLAGVEEVRLFLFFPYTLFLGGSSTHHHPSSLPVFTPILLSLHSTRNTWTLSRTESRLRSSQQSSSRQQGQRGQRRSAYQRSAPRPLWQPSLPMANP